MKRIFIVSLLFILIFSLGCTSDSGSGGIDLLEPTKIEIKALNVEGDNTTLEVNSNKEIANQFVSVGIYNKSWGSLCHTFAYLKKGDNLIELKDCQISKSSSPTVFARIDIKLDPFPKFTEEFEVELDEKNMKERANLSIERTFEGKIMEMFKENIAKSEECTTEKYLTNWNKIQEMLNEKYTRLKINLESNVELNEEQTSLFQKQLDKAKDCSVEVKKEIIDEGNYEYKIKYSLLFEGECNVYGNPIPQEDMIIFKVDLKSQYQRAEMIKGESTIKGSDDAWEETQYLTAIYETVGECTKQWLMGINPVKLLLPSEALSNQKQCTQTPNVGSAYSENITGNLHIKNYEFNDDKIILQIENMSKENHIAINQVRGRPDGISLINPEDNQIEASSEKTVELKGDFTGNLLERIILFYKENGESKQHVSLCVGQI